MFRFYYRPIQICDSESLKLSPQSHVPQLLNTWHGPVSLFSSFPVHIAALVPQCLGLHLSLFIPCVSVFLSLSVYFCVSFFRLTLVSFHLLFFLPLLLSICMYIRLPVFFSICLSFCLSVRLSICLSVFLSVWESHWVMNSKESKFQVYGRSLIAWK